MIMMLQLGRAGHPEYPFIHINKTPIIDSIHLAGMGEDKSNVYKKCEKNANRKKYDPTI